MTHHIMSWSYQNAEHFIRLAGLNRKDCVIHTAETVQYSMRGVARGTKVTVLGPEDMYDPHYVREAWATLTVRGVRMIPDSCDRLMGVVRP
ncbi:hypothetical protein ACGFZA_15900 [Streptomyces sp. NPDC048211]|uniref:hypothetical protein n=1 Tax=Streptomyces sp. NPDC048211 TaxID=3365516 RepID=UPI0037149BE6